MSSMASVLGGQTWAWGDILRGATAPLRAGAFEPGIHGLAAILLLATASVLVVTRLGYGPRAKRTYLFENDDGERVNPFEAISEGAARSTRTCDECGTMEVPESFRYCVRCVSTGVPDE